MNSNEGVRETLNEGVKSEEVACAAERKTAASVAKELEADIDAVREALVALGEAGAGEVGTIGGDAGAGAVSAVAVGEASGVDVGDETDESEEEEEEEEGPSFLQVAHSHNGVERGSQRSSAAAGVDLRSSSRSLLHKRLVKDPAALQQVWSTLSLISPNLVSALQASAASGEDVFERVQELIKQMISRLNAEASAESSKHTYCKTSEKREGTNLEKAKKQKERATARLEGLRSEAEKTKLEAEKSRSEAEELRNQERNAVKGRAREEKLNQALITDARKNAEELGQAIFSLQTRARLAKVVEVVKMVEADATKLADETQREETVAREQREALRKQRQVELAVLTKAFQMGDVEKVRLKGEILRGVEDIRLLEEEIVAMEGSLFALKEECAGKQETAEERMARREAVIKSLEQALEVLRGEGGGG